MNTEREQQPLGVFRAVSTKDAVAQVRDGWPYFVINPIGLATDGERLFEICFGDGEWMLAAEGDL